MTDARPKDTKTVVREQALRLVAARGYDGVSMRDIAEAVGVRQGAIYNHFQSKQHLLADLMTGHMERVLAALDKAMTGVEGAAARLEHFARFHASYHIDYPEDVFIAYMELRSLEPENLTLISDLRHRYEDVLADILRDGIAAGVFHVPDAVVHARALLSMLTGVTVWFRDGGRLDRATVVECYVTAALQSTGLPPRTTGDT